MNKTNLILGALIILSACGKTGVSPTPPPEETHPQMTYINLTDSAIVFGKGASFDFDGNGEKDVFFVTQLVGDPIYKQDKRQWIAASSFHTNLPVNANESLPVMRSLDDIPVTPFSGYDWYNASEIVIAQKIISVDIPPYWNGDWKDVSHRFLPFQIIKPNGLFNGWVEVSFSTDNEKLILHKAAICKETNKPIKAGK